MNFNRLEYIKNVTDDHAWAYDIYSVSSYFKLNFKADPERRVEIEKHALKIQKASLIILSQRPKTETNRYLTHIVELANDGSEDKYQWNDEIWGIFRWVKVLWVADFSNPSSIPVDSEVLKKVNWGWYDTKAKSLSSRNLMEEWGNIDELRAYLRGIFQ